ncbi:MAG: hypothetical protein Q4F95_00405 [Oscillospiraceae bacterium]|nr:hypothetical protein [Oscillospiraceae bacterium]
MTLLISLIASVIVTLIWYLSEKARTLKTGMLCYMYWGASIMWSVDAAVEYLRNGADYFSPDITDMINDAFLGLSAITLGLVIWVIRLLITDPVAVVKRSDK